jgi:hypothetical protein
MQLYFVEAQISRTRAKSLAGAMSQGIVAHRLADDLADLSGDTSAFERKQLDPEDGLSRFHLASARSGDGP